MHENTYIIIPVYNEAIVLKQVLDTVLLHFSNVVCVNDGSIDESEAVIVASGAYLVNHPVNLGQGAALQTGIEYALQDPEAQYFVTFDSDGQHDIQDALSMLQYIESHPETDIILGSRFLGKSENISNLKKMILKLAVKFSNFTTGVQLSDAHNGLRVFNRKVAKNLDITMPDMAHASEIIHRIAERNFVYEEIPVTITYTGYSKKKGQSIMNAVNITFDLLLQKVTRK